MVLPHWACRNFASTHDSGWKGEGTVGANPANRGLILSNTLLIGLKVFQSRSRMIIAYSIRTIRLPSAVAEIPLPTSPPLLTSPNWVFRFNCFLGSFSLVQITSSFRSWLRPRWQMSRLLRKLKSTQPLLGKMKVCMIHCVWARNGRVQWPTDAIWLLLGENRSCE